MSADFKRSRRPTWAFIKKKLAASRSFGVRNSNKENPGFSWFNPGGLFGASALATGRSGVPAGALWPLVEGSCALAFFSFLFFSFLFLFFFFAFWNILQYFSPGVYFYLFRES